MNRGPLRFRILNVDTGEAYLDESMADLEVNRERILRLMRYLTGDHVPWRMDVVGTDPAESTTVLSSDVIAAIMAFVDAEEAEG